jgi:hypothetical protein
VCSTFFCKVNRPAKGREFWDELKGLLATIEMAVAVHCALELGIAGPIVDQVLVDPNGLKSPADVDGLPDADAQAKLWGDWLGREEEYYVACAQRADQLDLPAIRALGGITLARRLDATKKAFDAMLATALPARLKIAATLNLSPGTPGKIRLLAGPNQPIEMQAVVVELLSYFQGQPLDEAKATLAEQGFELDGSFLEKLWHYGFLVEA